MQSLFRRPSGIYVFRLAVPALLRQVFGKTEVIDSTGTRELAMAKIVASAMATQWRQRFCDARRLLSATTSSTMDYQEILRLTNGSPVLLGTGHLTLKEASAASGVRIENLLRAAGDGKLSLFVPGAGIRGFLLRYDELELDDPELGAAGGYVIPTERQMPQEALPHICQTSLKISSLELPSLTTALIAGEQTFDLVAYEIPDKSFMAFVPSKMISVTIEALEVVAYEVERLRQGLASRISPERLREARSLQKAALHVAIAKKGDKASELLSTALDAYITNRVRQDVTKEGEITRIRNGCALLIDLAGDIPIGKIDTDQLRQFRDKKLSQVPANENKIRLMHGTTSVLSSMKQVEGTDWPIMSAAERNKRMRWISAWFSWLRLQKWIGEDPAAAMHGESVQTKAQRRKDKTKVREDEARDPFTQDDLNKIFSADWFKTGRGQLTQTGTYRTFMPLYYWLPLLGLYAGGGRINELSQLHLADIQKTKSGQWYVNFNEEAEDQDLKNTPSKRKVPLHPMLITLGFENWISALRKAGYTRLFPELKHNSEKGYGKTSTKWFTNFMAGLGIPRNGKKTFHSFRHTYTNALPEDTPDRMRRQMTGHARGRDAHDKTYKKEAKPELAAQYVSRMAITLPEIACFDIEVGLAAIKDALQRKNGGRGANEDVGVNIV